MSQNSISNQQPRRMKKNRNGYGNPDPDAKVVKLSVEEIISEKRYICEICNKEYHRNQNLRLHKHGEHKIPCNVMDPKNNDKKKVYTCPVPSCEYHQASRALTSITAIKKHYFRIHGEKKWKCENCPKSYAAQSDLKNHLQTCESNQYKCECGTHFSSKDSFTAHKGCCKSLPEGSDKLTTTNPNDYTSPLLTNHPNHQIAPPPPLPFSSIPVPFWVPKPQNPSPNNIMNIPQLLATAPASHASSTTDMDVTSTWKINDIFTRLTGNKRPRVGGSGSGSEVNREQCGGVGGSASGIEVNLEQGGGAGGSASGSEVNLEQGGGVGGSDSWSDMDDLDLSAIWELLDD